jgi:hypothetical protein
VSSSGSSSAPSGTHKYPSVGQENHIQKARDDLGTNPFTWGSNSLLDHQSSFGPSQESDADDPAAYIDAVKKLDELPAHLKRLQRRVFEAETARRSTELKLRECEERIRVLQIENELLKTRQAF